MESLLKSVPDFAFDVSRSWLETPYLGYCEGEDCGRILRHENSLAARVAIVGGAMGVEVLVVHNGLRLPAGARDCIYPILAR